MLIPLIAGQVRSNDGEALEIWKVDIQKGFVPPDVPRRTRGPVKVREVIRLLEDDGWYLVVTRGSHRQFKHPWRAGRVTVSGNLGDDMPKGTLASVLRQSGLRRRDS